MSKTVILAASALMTSIFALPYFEGAEAIAARQSDPDLEPLANWQASNFEPYCTIEGCTARFNLTAEAGYYPGSPGFTVHCQPVRDGGWSVCEVNEELQPKSSVEAQWTDTRRDDFIRLTVANIWREGEARYNASGWTEVNHDTKEFDFPVLQITGGL